MKKDTLKKKLQKCKQDASIIIKTEQELIDKRGYGFRQSCYIKRLAYLSGEIAKLERELEKL